jgi:hypothetical protein
MEPSVTLSRAQVMELLAHLVASADTCSFEPGYYGTFRLIDAASRLAAAVLDAGLDDPWLERFRQEIEHHKLLLVTDRDAYFRFLPEAARMLGEHLREGGLG